MAVLVVCCANRRRDNPRLCGREALPVRLAAHRIRPRRNVFIRSLHRGRWGSVLAKGAIYLAPLFAALTTIAVLSIPARAIDHDKARARNGGSTMPDSTLRVLFRYRPLLVFAAPRRVPLRQRADVAARRPKARSANPGWETGLTSAAIIVAQFATILMALLVTRANVLGRKPLLLLAFAALPLRGGLCIWLTIRPGSWPSKCWMASWRPFRRASAARLADIMRDRPLQRRSRRVGTVQGSAVRRARSSPDISSQRPVQCRLPDPCNGATAGLLLIIIAMPETTRHQRVSPS